MGNEFFYTFSTIPQVLAAVIALVGVFAIFQIQHLNKILNGLAQNFFDGLMEERRTFEANDMKSFIGDDQISELKRGKLTYKYSFIANKMDCILDILKNPRPEFHKIGNDIKEEFSRIIDRKSKLIRNTIISTGYSCILILIAISIIPFSNSINDTLSWLVLISFFVATCFGIYLIFRIIKNALIE